jgi:hypothetical protein
VPQPFRAVVQRSLYRQDLRGCGIVVAEPEGRRVRYELADARLGDALRTLAGIVLAVDPNCEHGR